VFIFKDTEPSPLQDSFGVRQKGDLPGLPPHPESIAAQAAYIEALLTRSAPARIVSRHWGPPIGGPSSPTGTAAAECPGEQEPPAWEVSHGPAN
jgi:hypothetical protein